MSRTVTEVKQLFEQRGLSVSGWARHNGFSESLVYQVLSGKREPVRGQSHRIAIALGLKTGMESDYDEVSELLKVEEKQ